MANVNPAILTRPQESWFYEEKMAWGPFTVQVIGAQDRAVPIWPADFDLNLVSWSGPIQPIRAYVNEVLGAETVWPPPGVPVWHAVWAIAVVELSFLEMWGENFGITRAVVAPLPEELVLDSAAMAFADAFSEMGF